MARNGAKPANRPDARAYATATISSSVMAAGTMVTRMWSRLWRGEMRDQRAGALVAAARRRAPGCRCPDRRRPPPRSLRPGGPRGSRFRCGSGRSAAIRAMRASRLRSASSRASARMVSATPMNWPKSSLSITDISTSVPPVRLTRCAAKRHRAVALGRIVDDDEEFARSSPRSAMAAIVPLGRDWPSRRLAASSPTYRTKPTILRTSLIVCSAITEARAAPSAMKASMVAGSATGGAFRRRSARAWRPRDRRAPA